MSLAKLMITFVIMTIMAIIFRKNITQQDVFMGVCLMLAAFILRKEKGE